MTNPIQTIKDLTQSALGDINAAATLADLEKVRVAVLGRKGELAGHQQNVRRDGAGRSRQGRPASE